MKNNINNYKFFDTLDAVTSMEEALQWALNKYEKIPKGYSVRIVGAYIEKDGSYQEHFKIEKDEK